MNKKKEDLIKRYYSSGIYKITKEQKQVSKKPIKKKSPKQMKQYDDKKQTKKNNYVPDND